MANVIEQAWDGPWYRVRTDRFEASFLPGAGEDLDTICDVDVEVRLTGDGSRWHATVLTYGEVGRLMDGWARTGEALAGRYFWCADGLIVREPGIGRMTQVIAGLFESNEFAQIFQRVEEE